jgi:hypothetical protein
VWNLGVEYSITAYKGNESDKGLMLLHRSFHDECRTVTEDSPLPVKAAAPSYEANLTALLQHLDKDFRAQFAIDRNQPSCRTPCHNDEVDALTESFSYFESNFLSPVASYLSDTLWTKMCTNLCRHNEGLIFHDIADKRTRIFVPVLPILDDSEDHNGTVSSISSFSCRV